MISVAIETIAAGGDGVGHLPDGRAVFVPRTAPGDTAEMTVRLGDAIAISAGQDFAGMGVRIRSRKPDHPDERRPHSLGLQGRARRGS